ncbi:MAG: ribosome recycling factor [Rickettsiaceae bacterium]|nr:MAG: ribosome recycling factor [Rickettsiaceae bacterium]
MDKTEVKKDLINRMEGALLVLDNSLKGIVAGRASTHLLDPVKVEAYGNKTPLSQISTISTLDSRTLAVQVWDKSMVKSVEKAIVDCNLGISPVADGQVIRISIPMLNEQRRKELGQLSHKYGENCKISIRNIRRDGNESLKKAEKDNIISKDEHHNLSVEIQKITDEYIAKVDLCIKNKEQELTI